MAMVGRFRLASPRQTDRNRRHTRWQEEGHHCAFHVRFEADGLFLANRLFKELDGHVMLLEPVPSFPGCEGFSVKAIGLCNRRSISILQPSDNEINALGDRFPAKAAFDQCVWRLHSSAMLICERHLLPP